MDSKRFFDEKLNVLTAKIKKVAPSKALLLLKYSTEQALYAKKMEVVYEHLLKNKLCHNIIYDTINCKKIELFIK